MEIQNFEVILGVWRERDMKERNGRNERGMRGGFIGCAEQVGV